MFCEKAKYLKATKTREALIQSIDLHVDSTIRRAAAGKNDPRILAIVTREFIEAEACYHKSCYRDYTRNFKELLAVVIRKRKMSVLHIPMQNHKPKRTPSEMKDQKVNTGIFKPVTRLTVEKIPV